MTTRNRTSAKIKLTKLAIDKLIQKAQRQGEIVVWDSELTGFGVRISSTGRCTYFVYARGRSGRQFKEKIGVHGTIPADKARDLAKTKLGEIASGDNPAEKRKAGRAAEARVQAGEELRPLPRPRRPPLRAYCPDRQRSQRLRPVPSGDDVLTA